MNMNSYTVAVNLENIDSGLITLHQASFNCENRYEAIGRAVEKFIKIQSGAIHSYKVNLVSDGEHEDYIYLIEEGRKIESIKLRRERSGEGLKEAKEWIDDLIIRLGIETR
jgi:ribosomal protein L7/L12